VTKTFKRAAGAALRRFDEAVNGGGFSREERIELLLESDIGKAAAADAVTRKVKRRTELVAKKRRAQEAAEREVPVLVRELEERRAAVEAQAAVLRAAEQAAHDAYLAMRYCDINLRRTVSECDFELESIAPKEIDQFVARCGGAAEQLRTRGQFANATYEQTNEYLEQLGRAIQEATALKLTDLDDEDLRAAIERIESKIVRDAAP
jgi:hypothetical protein